MAALSNDKPVLTGLISEIVIDAVQYEANSTYEDPSVYEYISPIATDTENDEIKFAYSGETGKPYLKITSDASKAQFTLSIDRSLITEKDEGEFPLGISVSDAAGTNKYSIPITINYKLIEEVIVAPPVEEEEPVVKETTTEEGTTKVQVAGALGEKGRTIAPQRINFDSGLSSKYSAIIHEEFDEDLSNFSGNVTLTPEQEAKLNKKVDATVDLLTDTLGDLDGGLGEEEEVEEGDSDSNSTAAANDTASVEEEAVVEEPEPEPEVEAAENKTEASNTTEAAEPQKEEEKPEAKDEKATTAKKAETAKPATQTTPQKKEEKPKPKPKPKKKVPKKRPKGAKAKGWFKKNVQSFKAKLKKFGGDYMNMVAKMKPKG